GDDGVEGLAPAAPNQPDERMAVIQPPRIPARADGKLDLGAVDLQIAGPAEFDLDQLAPVLGIVAMHDEALAMPHASLPMQQIQRGGVEVLIDEAVLGEFSPVGAPVGPEVGLRIGVALLQMAPDGIEQLGRDIQLVLAL